MNDRKEARNSLIIAIVIGALVCAIFPVGLAFKLFFWVPLKTKIIWILWIIMSIVILAIVEECPRSLIALVIITLIHAFASSVYYSDYFVQGVYVNGAFIRCFGLFHLPFFAEIPLYFFIKYILLKHDIKMRERALARRTAIEERRKQLQGEISKQKDELKRVESMISERERIIDAISLVEYCGEKDLASVVGKINYISSMNSQKTRAAQINKKINELNKQCSELGKEG